MTISELYTAYNQETGLVSSVTYCQTVQKWLTLQNFPAAIKNNLTFPEIFRNFKLLTNLNYIDFEPYRLEPTARLPKT